MNTLVRFGLRSSLGRPGRTLLTILSVVIGVAAFVSVTISTRTTRLAYTTMFSAVTGKAEIMDAPAPGGLGGTYAGNPLAIAAAHAVIDVMAEERLPERGQMLGDQLKAVLEGLRGTVPQIADIRGLGAMVAVEFDRKDNAEPDADMAKRVQAEALSRGLILLSCGVNGNVIRFLFPLTIQQPVFDEAMGILRAALPAAAARA